LISLLQQYLTQSTASFLFSGHSIMKAWHKRFIYLFLIIDLTILAPGCIRLFGHAGYVKETSTDRTERVVGFDTAKAFENQQSKGSVTT